MPQYIVTQTPRNGLKNACYSYAVIVTAPHKRAALFTAIAENMECIGQDTNYHPPQVQEIIEGRAYLL